jgi:GDP-L-fucose synthase
MSLSKTSRIFIAGHRGMVGSAVWRRLTAKGYEKLIGRSSSELDLRNSSDVTQFLHEEKPEAIVDCAARVGGIGANAAAPYKFLMDNLQIQNNLIQGAYELGVKKFIFLGSSCIYPKLAPQPLKEEYLLTSPLEPTNEGYALAKIAGLKACEYLKKFHQKDFVSLMPTNLYGPGDQFDLERSHVLPAMMRKFHEAKIKGHSPVTLWGDGSPLREFLHVDDLASAVLLALEQSLEAPFYNVGSGEEITVSQLAMLVQQAVGHRGEILCDNTKPNGTPRKLLDSSKIKTLGWHPTIPLQQGLNETYAWFLKHT